MSCTQGPFPFAGRSVELWMLRSLPPGNYSVPLFIRDKQGLSRKQTVHVRVCSCPDGVTCAEPSVTGAGLLVGALVPPFAAFVALAGQWSAELSSGCGSSPRPVSRQCGVLPPGRGAEDGRDQWDALRMTPRLIGVTDSDQTFPTWSDMLPVWREQLLFSRRLLIATEPVDERCALQ